MLKGSYIVKKGKIYELEIAKLLSKELKIRCRRTPNSGAIRHYFDGDIMVFDNKPNIIQNVLIEVKNRANINMPEWILRTEQEAKDADRKRWLIIFRHKAKGYACLSIDYLLELLKKAQEKL